MTREEAIKHGKEQLEIFGEGCEHYEFIKMAIKALEQEPQCTEHPCLGTLCRYYKEPCEDAVSRQDVLDLVAGEISHETYEGIYALPSVTQKNCDDAISREMALKECHDIIIDGERYRVIQEETLLGLPPVTQKSIEDMPCITPEEMQKCKEVVKKYAPSVTQKPIECNDCIFKGV